MSIKSLKYRCEQPTSDLLQNQRYRFIDNGASILGVAHCDYVGCGLDHFVQQGKRVYSTRLDDRLGVHLLLDQLPKMGLRFDVLLTDDEEIGCSTASEFKLPEGKKYNWLFQFDRRGADCVTYDFDSMIPYAQKHFVMSNGSFSDICCLEHLGVAGMNIGTGYYHEHTPRSFADLGETYQQCKRFVRFYNEHRDTEIVHESELTSFSYQTINRKDDRIDARWNFWQEYADFARKLGFESLTDVLDTIGETDYEFAFDYLDAVSKLPAAEQLMVRKDVFTQP